MKFEIKHVETTGSSNDDALSLALSGAKEGVLVWTDEQTKGKGRSGRRWESVAKENLYFSLILKPEYDLPHAARTTIVMALAVSRAISRLTGQSTQIKWPNDVVLNKRKVCGILTELHLREGIGPILIVGVGVNVNQTGFPEEISDTASSMHRETCKEYEIKAVLDAILFEFDRLYSKYKEALNLSFMKEEYEEVLANMGNRVRVLDPQNPYEGVAKGITDTGELLVLTDENELRTVYAGEVSVRGIYGYV